MNSNQFFFVLSISPVQSFISQARKTKDLYAGSHVLSELCRKAIEIFESYGGNVILPAKKNDSLPNIFLGEVYTEKSELKNVGNKIEEELKTFFKNKSVQKIAPFAEFESQIDDFLEINWLFYPYEKDNYQESYKKIAELHSAIKNVKRFKPFEEKAGRKCSLCGVRNALFCGKKGKQKWKENLIREKFIEDTEGLCGICYAKRVLDHSLPSLANICLMDWLKNIKKDELVKLRTEINFFDEEMFFNPELDSIKEFIKEHSLDVKKQKKYYALLKLDIDDMGKWLSGKNGTNGKDLKTFQIELSEKLTECSSSMKAIIDEYCYGKTVYAGGDDFLGFVNLEYLFEVVSEIKDIFKFEERSILKKLTYSISIVISHYKSPLHKVLDLSRELMEETKNAFDDKNGMGVIVLSNSSIHSKCYCRYESFILLKKLWEEKTGNNLYFKLGQQFPFLKDVYSYDNYLLNKSMLETEIIRLLKKENKDVEDEHVEGIINFLSDQTIEEGSNANRIDFENFIGYLKTLEQLRKVM